MTTQSPPTPTLIRPPEATATANRATMVVAIAGGFLALLDTTVVNVSLNATTTAFGQLDNVQWVLTSYLLALIATMPATAWLADRFGAKRVFLASTVLFGLGSLACALATTLPLLVASRGLAGAAAGVLTPASTILLTRGVPREQLGRVQSLNGSLMLVGPLLGPTIGGLLVQAGGWPAVYVINVPICAVLVAVAIRRVEPDRSAEQDPAARRPLDVGGLLSAVVCTVSLVLTIHQFSEDGPADVLPVLVPLAVAVVAGTVFVVRGLRCADPLLDLRLFAIGGYRMAALNVFFLGFILYGPLVVIPLYFEAARGETAIVTGLLLSTAGIGVVFAGWLCRRLFGRVGFGKVMVMGIVLTMVATVPLTLLSADTSYWLICASLVVRGIGGGLTIVPAMTKAYMSIKARSIGDASSQLNLLQRLGGTLAAAVVTLVVHHEAVAQHGLVPIVFAHASLWVFGTSALTLLPAFALVLAERRERRADR